jgi:hypothetical protein
MPTRTLSHLIRHRGIYGGTAGQSFRGHVPPNAAGQHMAGYIINGFSEFTGDVPFMGPPAITYGDGEVFDPINIGISRGAYAPYVMREGDVVEVTQYQTIDGFLAIKNWSSVSGGGGSMSVTVRAPFFTGGGDFSPSAWYDGYPGPPMHNEKPPHCDPHNIRYEWILTQGSTGEGPVECGIWVTYQPQASGDFNPVCQANIPLMMSRRLRSYGDYEMEWHADANYNSLVGTGNIYYVVSSPWETTYSPFFRFRQTGGGWTNKGQQSFFDFRPWC